MNFSSGDVPLDEAIINWLKWDQNPKTRAEVRDAIAEQAWAKLKSVMIGRLKFGTAGLRGRMAAGTKCMNDVVVLQAAQGLAAYYQKTFTPEELEKGVVIGYDGRLNSQRFAELSANVFINASMKVHLFGKVVPTPFVSFATIKYGCVGGIMVTASHNPKDDNGYKVYWNNGSQIITPHDDNILEAINENLNIDDEHWNIENISSNPLISDPYDEIMESYCEYIKDIVGQENAERNAKVLLPVVYSAMHGVGAAAVKRAFESANLQEPIYVKEQMEPDPEFTTVSFPNPEELDALSLSQETAENNGVNLVLVNDPDADRLAVAEFDQSSQTWRVFTGNEVGVLLGWWMLQQYKKQEHPCEKLYFLSSVVSSRMLKSIADKEGCKYIETLTGFKWMGNKSIQLMKNGMTPMFAYEEAIGYMCSSRVPDKDGVSAAVQVATLASYLKEQNMTLVEKLNDLYDVYGYHVTMASYFICDDPKKSSKIFHFIRNYEGSDCVYPTKAGDMEILKVQDYSTPEKKKIIDEIHQDVTKPDEELVGTGLDLPYTSGEMISFEFENNFSLKLRTSGTEPKLKYYAEIVSNAKSAEDKAKVRLELNEKVKKVVEDLVRPHENGLVH